MTGSHDARERLIAAAERLLTQSGPGSVSMDAVAAAAGAGKMSAYRHFASKQDLVAAALERHNPRHVRWLVGARRTARLDQVSGTGPAGADPGGADPGGADPVESILSAFGRLESAAISEPFRGCPFVDAALAAPGTEDRPGRIAWQHKQQVTRELAGLAARAGLPEPGELGAAVALTIDGAAVQAALAPDAASRQQIIRRARHVAEVLLAVAAGRAPGHWQELEERPEGPGERACPEEQP
jgi:AcrR family transcriptional regulator